jgi:hypothetical protein
MVGNNGKFDARKREREREREKKKGRKGREGSE